MPTTTTPTADRIINLLTQLANTEILHTKTNERTQGSTHTYCTGNITLPSKNTTTEFNIHIFEHPDSTTFMLELVDYPTKTQTRASADHTDSTLAKIIATTITNHQLLITLTGTK